jgi:hypothetical protein
LCALLKYCVRDDETDVPHIDYFGGGGVGGGEKRSQTYGALPAAATSNYVAMYGAVDAGPPAGMYDSAPAVSENVVYEALDSPLAN